MGEAYNFCDCKNNDPRLEEKFPDSNHKDLININNHSSTSSKKILYQILIKNLQMIL